MHYCGVDIAKGKHVIAVANQTRAWLWLFPFDPFLDGDHSHL